MLPDSATTRKGRCRSKKATTVWSTRKWRERCLIWEVRMGTLAMLPDSATAWKGRCESLKATTVRSTQKWRER
eukprot:1419036-Amphidinium_carterae.1